MPIHVLEEANRCLQCKNPQCRKGCPINTNIPEMIRLFKENELETAAAMLFANNPLSVVCSLVCNHGKQCEGHCVRGIKGSPVHISSIENYISDSCFERIKVKMAEPNGMKAAVIGAGPAGITIAILLASKGYKITVFESRDKIGGIMRYGIPEFRLPHSILDLGQSVAIFGSGNSAMDVARTAIRQGVKNVTVYERRDKVTASPDEFEFAKLDGVQFEFHETATAIKDDGVMLSETEVQEDGKVVTKPGTEHFVPCDSVVIAVSQVPQHRLVEHNSGLKLNERGTLATDAEGETTMPGVFASGDVVTGAKTVVDAVHVSKMIAEEMDQYMQAHKDEKA